MAYRLEDKLVVAVSEEALFAQTPEEDGREDALLLPGAAFSFIRRLLALNTHGRQEAEVILFSSGGGSRALSVYRNLSHYGLSIARAFFLRGGEAAPYLEALGADLFLTARWDEACAAARRGIAAGLLEGAAPQTEREDGALRIAFDGDAVLFEDGAERVFQSGGLAAFERHEVQKAATPLRQGPFAALLRKLCAMQRRQGETPLVRTALVTARCAPAHERVLRTLRAWGTEPDELFFLGGVEKREILRAFGADIFFDDQRVHTSAAAGAVLAALVPPCGEREADAADRANDANRRMTAAAADRANAANFRTPDAVACMADTAKIRVPDGRMMFREKLMQENLQKESRARAAVNRDETERTRGIWRGAGSYAQASGLTSASGFTPAPGITQPLGLTSASGFIPESGLPQRSCAPVPHTGRTYGTTGRHTHGNAAFAAGSPARGSPART